MTAGPRLSWVLLGVSLLISTVLVVGAFNPAPHTGGDNAGYVSLAYGLLTTGTYTEVFDPARFPHTKYPPVFPAILAALMWLGARTWTAFKTTAAVSTTLAVGFTYLWTQRRLGLWPAFAVAVLLGSSSAVVYYSHWILSDPVFLAFTMAALWALDRSDDAGAAHRAWLSLGVGLAGMAYFTRSAGLPLVLAILAWLALKKRWVPLGATVAALGIPALAWWLRGHGAPGSYSTEFWMVDPYQPALGTIGLLGLVPRALANSLGYVLRHGPSGIVGSAGPWVGLLGVVLTLAALYGWLRSARKNLGPAELFAPLYAGLILLWPEVWAGDRFALPLYPLVFFYGAVAIGDLCGRLRLPPRAVGPVAAVAVLAILMPATASWARESGTARACARILRSGGPFACYGPQVVAFASAAEWAGGALPAGAAVLSRKPRHFYVLSGVPSRTFPFDDTPEGQLAGADAAGAKYVLIDEWDGLAARYVGGAVVRRPGAFCFVRGFGRPGVAGAQLVGILPPRDRSDAPSTRGEVRLGPCPDGYGTEDGEVRPYSSSAKIPLLDRLDP